MPFSRAEYEVDFSGSHAPEPGETLVSPEEDLGQFRRLLAHATEQIEMDGSHEQSLAAASYEAVGRYVAHHSDVLIAVWDGRQAQGLGGTAEIVRIAANAAIPVLWIHATQDTEPLWMEDAQDLRDPGTAARPHTAWQCLATYLESILTPPVSELPRSEGVITKISMAFRRDLQSPLHTYLSEKPSTSRAWVWKAYAALMVLSRARAIPWQEVPAPEDRIGGYWAARYRMTDRLANEYAARYRSSYVWIIFLTAFTILLAAMAEAFMAFKDFPRFVLPFIGGIELCALLLILLLVIGSIRNGWHVKSIEYRLFAELFRKQQLLASLDRSLPFNNVQHFAESENISWISWLFAACVRDAPLANTPVLNFEERRARVDGLLREQISYHQQRESNSYRVVMSFERGSTAAFIGVVVCVAAKFTAELRTAPEAFAIITGMLATILPAISAAFVTLRSYSELTMLAEQSRHMILQLQRAQMRIDRLGAHRILAAQDLGAEATQIGLIMLQDLEGWGRLFRGKVTEAG